MKLWILCCSLLLVASSFGQDEWPKDISQNVRIRLVSARQSENRDLHLIAKFASVEGKGGKEFELPFYGRKNPHEATLRNVIRSCVSWDSEKNHSGWRPLKLDLVLSAPANWSDVAERDYSRWFVESIDIHSSK